MQKIIYTGWITLDGYIAGGDGGMDWVRGDDELAAYETDIIRSVDSVMLGRKTYEDFSSYWPRIRENPQAAEWEKVYGDILNPMRKIVVSTGLKTGEWGPATMVAELAVAEIEQLKLQSGRGILIYGSASVVQTLTQLRLIDEYQLLVHPVVLGGGKRLFENTGERLDLKLAGGRQFKSGIELLTYQLD